LSRDQEILEIEEERSRKSSSRSQDSVGRIQDIDEGESFNEKLNIMFKKLYGKTSLT